MNINDNIEVLNLDSNIIKKLKEHNIITINDLWKKKRLELKKIGLKDSQINHIIVHMQLNGIDLNKKNYEK